VSVAYRPVCAFVRAATLVWEYSYVNISLFDYSI
jgi:hypothetical protein